MCLAQNIKNGLILTKSPTYISCFFPQNWTIFDPTKMSKLNTQFERPYKELLNALFSFEIHHS